MLKQSGVETCLHFLSSQVGRIPSLPASAKSDSPLLAITISRQTGSGAHSVAGWLARDLQTRNPQAGCDWTVFDRDLIERVLKDHNLPTRLARFMPEDRVPAITDVLDELLGVHPPVSTLLRQTAETILQLANRGNAILIGRGAHIITSKLGHVFHVRLVGSLEKRIERVREIRGTGEKEALALIRQEDRGRQRYLKTYFGRDIDDPLSYHLTINTDSGCYEKAARLICDGALDYLHARQTRGCAIPSERAWAVHGL